MNRSILLAVAAALVAPLAMAHTPAQPILTCQDPALGFYHEYIPPVQGNLIIGSDGNLADCGHNDLETGTVFNPSGTTCATVGALPFLCESISTGQNNPVGDYDGEYDFSQGGAWLFADSGDGVSAGVIACYGEPAVGHHSGNVFALDDAGFGPRFLLTSDYSRAGEEDSPDCGDGLIEACDPTPPEPSEAPAPLNVVFDTYSETMYSIFGPSGDGCNPRDFEALVAANPAGATNINAPFGPGVDGSYTVFILPDLDANLFPVSGHVWTK